MTERTIICKQATYVTVNKSTIYYPSGKTNLRAQEATNDSYIFLYFEIPEELVGQTPTQADVRIKAFSGAWSSATTLQRHAKPKTAYSKMNGNNLPGALAGSSSVAGTQDVTDTSWWAFDMLADAVAIAGGGAYYGFKLATTSTTLRQFFGALTDTPPVMYLAYSDVPSTPSGVKPSGGIVSTNKPWITWPNGRDIDAVQVQLKHSVGATWDKDTGFAAATFDSGSYGATSGQYNLAASAYAGLPNTGVQGNEVTTRQHGVSGWSEWSEPVPLGYAPRPAGYAFTSPDPSSADPTPPHVVTGTPVVAWQMFTRDAATGKTLWNSGLTGDDDPTATPTAGPSATGQDVVSYARLYDRGDRIESPGEPAYTEISLAWEYEPDSDADTFVSGDVAQVEGTPAVRWSCQWTGTLPDEIIVDREGERVTRFPFDENTSGSSGWSGIDWSCPPNKRNVEYSFTPMVGGVAGPSYKAVVSTVVEGLWLVDPTDGTALTFYGTDGTAVQAESSAAYVPLSGPRVILRTSGHRGEEGDVRVGLWDYEDEEVHEMAETFAELRSRATTRELRQIGGRKNFAVALLNMSETDDRENMLIDQDARVISWSYYQTDFPDDADGLAVSL